MMVNGRVKAREYHHWILFIILGLNRKDHSTHHLFPYHLNVGIWDPPPHEMCLMWEEQKCLKEERKRGEEEMYKACPNVSFLPSSFRQCSAFPASSIAWSHACPASHPVFLFLSSMPHAKMFNNTLQARASPNAKCVSQCLPPSRPHEFFQRQWQAASRVRWRH